MTKNKKGFTIIEVVLVLAIAGLIFLMVFIALPALQRSQRNTRRRQDMSRILSSFTDYAANNGGKVPSDAAKLATLVNCYIVGDSGYATATTVVANSEATGGMTCGDHEQFCDPDGTSYYFSSPTNTTGTTTYSGSFDHKINYHYHGKCGADEGSIEKGNGDSDVAIAYILEGGAVYCGDNQ
jgi:prepilin-type N-terminal cleavage/methylation domain-containing protein